MSSIVLVIKILKRKRENTTPYHRIILGMTILDIPFSFTKALATLPIPAETGVVGGHGTVATCAAAGFFSQWGAVTPLYMASLSIYFLLRVRYNVSDAMFRSRYEIFLHAVPWLFCWVTSIVGASYKVFNAIALPELGCWLGGWPLACTYIPGMECERGNLLEKHPTLLPWIFSYAWLFLTLFIVLVCNALIYKSIRDQEKKNQAYGSDEIVRRRVSLQEAAQSAQSIRRLQSGGSSRSNRSVRVIEESSSRSVLFQNILYVSFSFFTAIWMFMPWLGLKLQVSAGWRLFFAFMVNIFLPFQGFINLVIYVRPRYLKLYTDNPEWSFLKAVGKSLVQAP